jgi:hypothetical protein
LIDWLAGHAFTTKAKNSKCERITLGDVSTESSQWGFAMRLTPSAPTPIGNAQAALLSRKGTIWFLGIAASLVLLGSLASALVTWHFKHTSLHALGIVTDVAAELDDSTTTYRAVYRFRAADGNEYKVVSALNSQPATHKVGDQVTVLYSSDNPSEARIDSFLEMWFVPAVGALLGMTIGAVALFVGLMKSSS